MKTSVSSCVCWVCLPIALGVAGCGSPEEDLGENAFLGHVAQTALLNGCYKVRSVSNGRWLDAYTGGNGQVVTRNWQGNWTQTWCFSREDDHYRIRHGHPGGQFLDAYKGCCDFKVVLRDQQEDSSQDWYLLVDTSGSVAAGGTSSETDNQVGVGDVFRIVQGGSWRYLDAYQNDDKDYRAVTRNIQSNDTQLWRIVGY